MILCGGTTVGKGDRDGACAGIPPGRKSGGGRGGGDRVKKNIYIKISDGS